MPHNQPAAAQRRNMRGRLIMAFALIALAFTALPTMAFAGTDSAGNVFVSDGDSSPSGVEGDLYWAGQSLNLDDTSIDRDIIAAGESLSIRDCTVGGAVRLAARTIDIAKTTIDGSVTVAAQHVVLNSGSTANCFYAAGETVALRGSVKSAALAGSTVTIDGTVDGDVEVWADKLVLGKNAHITGTVNAHVSQDPERADGAKVGALKIDRTENEDTSTVNDTIGGIVAAALSACNSQRGRHASPAPRPAVGERSFGHGNRHTRSSAAHHLDCRPFARRSPTVCRDRCRAGLRGLYGHLDRAHGRAQTEPLCHGSHRRRHRRGPYGTPPHGQLYQRRSLRLYAWLSHPGHLA